VLENFPENYEQTELWQLPEHWAHQPSKTHIYNLNGADSTQTAKPLAVGEADRKIVWYIQNCANDYDEVLVRSNDSDILFILLVNMHLFRTKNGVWTRTVFLDMNTSNMKRDRLPRRFVCLNYLVEALEDKSNPENPLAGIPNPCHVIAVIALLCGSDYTQNPYGFGAKKIMDQFELVCKNKSVYGELYDLIRLGTMKVKLDPTDPIDMFNWQKHLEPLNLVLLKEEALDTFMRRLYQTRLTQKTIKKLSINTSFLLSWPKLSQYLHEQDQDKATAGSLHVPSEMERKGEMRRLMWTMTYWCNSHFNFGDFPKAEIEHPISGLSTWGWTRARKLITQDEGQDRFINKSNVDWKQERLMDYESRVNETHVKNPWVCCKNNHIVEFDAIWEVLAAEMLARSYKEVEIIKTPLWA